VGPDETERNGASFVLDQDGQGNACGQKLVFGRKGKPQGGNIPKESKVCRDGYGGDGERRRFLEEKDGRICSCYLTMST